MKIVCLGSGNVATHLAESLKRSGQDLLQIWSRNLEHAVHLGNRVQAQAIDDLGKIDATADLYIIAVKDDAISEVASALKGIKGLVVHTSGSTPIDVLSDLTNYGIFYPLQTFSKDKALNLRNVPVCIEAVNRDVFLKLDGIAGLLTDRVYEVNTEQRRVLHLAAVFACNFTNHLYFISQQLAEESGLDFELLKPLILETADKIQYNSPLEAQTGPALRGDGKTIARHLTLLEGRPDLQEIYTILSTSIKKTQE